MGQGPVVFTATLRSVQFATKSAVFTIDSNHQSVRMPDRILYTSISSCAMTPSFPRRSEKKAEEEMLATMDKPEWTVASTGGKKGELH